VLEEELITIRAGDPRYVDGRVVFPGVSGPIAIGVTPCDGRNRAVAEERAAGVAMIGEASVHDHDDVAAAARFDALRS